MNKANLKKILISYGIKVEGNFIRKSAIKTLVAKMIKSPKRDVVNRVACYYDDIRGHRQKGSAVYETKFKYLPDCIQKVIKETYPEVDDTIYAGNIPTAYLRLTILTKDQAEIDMEIYLGSVEIDYADQTDIDIEEEMYNKALDLRNALAWDNTEVLYDVVRESREQQILKEIRKLAR